jgi:hypothetical protein
MEFGRFQFFDILVPLVLKFVSASRINPGLDQLRFGLVRIKEEIRNEKKSGSPGQKLRVDLIDLPSTC